MTQDAAAARHPAGWYAILLATATIGMSNSVVFALLSNLQDEFGFANFGLGLIAGTGFVVGLVGQIVFAPLADRGHSKRLLLLGLAAAVAGSVSFALSTTLLMLVLSRCLTGVSNSLFLPSVRAIVSSIDRDRVAQRLGVLGAVELAGFVVGPTVGGLLVGPFGLKVPFLVMGTFAVLGLLLLAPRTLPEPPTDPHRRLAFDLLRIPRVRTAILLSIALFVPVGFYDSILDRYLTDLGAPDGLIGFAFLLFGVPFALLASTGGRIVDRIGAVRGAVITAVLVTPLVVSYGLIRSPLVIVLLSGVEGVVQALGIPAVQAAVASSAPEGRAGAAQGLAGAGNLAMGALTAFSAGPIYAGLGSEGMFAIAALGTLAVTGLALVQHGRSGVAPPADTTPIS
ncbi:MAG: MFS transporter [Ilumatobacteraceae bacterium]